MHPESQSILTHILKGDAPAAQPEFARLPDAVGSDERACLLRHAAFSTGQSFIYYQSLYNIWGRWGRPVLKPNPVASRIHLLSDLTIQGLVPCLELFSACFGVDADVSYSAFDSVEHVALSGELKDRESGGKADFGVLILSDKWLSRYFGSDILVEVESLDRCKRVLASIIGGLAEVFGSRFVLALFPGRTFPMPGGAIAGQGSLGWNSARREVNYWLRENYGEAHCLLDIPEVLSMAGGGASYGRSSYLRARMPYEPAGVEAVAREIVAVISNLLGKSHRALVTDFDNTLWGGVIAELGANGVESGTEAAGFGYHLIQKYVGQLGKIGVLLGGLSRNEAAVIDEVDKSPMIELSKDDFTALEVGHLPKSQGIAKISEAMAFGPDFMVFLDDSVFELIECLWVHPFLDAMRAGPHPEATLSNLSTSRFFQSGRLSSADLKRSDAAKSLSRQREASANFGSIDEFLKEIDIRVTVSELNAENSERVEQLFQKTNQFNLTTRRHSLKDLQQFVSDGATLGVFSYEDSFGPQGIISVILVQNGSDEVSLESWLMSCRVLNRGVEQAIFCWLVGQAGDRRIRAEYIPTQKNGLVSDLYKNLGFSRIDGDAAKDSSEGASAWEIAEPKSVTLPKHHVTLLAG